MTLKAGAIVVTLDRTKKIAQAITALASQRVYAGVPAEDATRDPEDGDEKPMNNAAIMYLNENGAPEANIPARPVVHPAIESIKTQVMAELKLGGRLALEGNTSAIERMYTRIGFLAQNAMRKQITEGEFSPLSPRTIAARKYRGRTGTKPLIDTGQLRRALTYVIRSVIGSK